MLHHLPGHDLLHHHHQFGPLDYPHCPNLCRRIAIFDFLRIFFHVAVIADTGNHNLDSNCPASATMLASETESHESRVTCDLMPTGYKDRLHPRFPDRSCYSTFQISMPWKQYRIYNYPINARLLAVLTALMRLTPGQDIQLRSTHALTCLPTPRVEPLPVCAPLVSFRYPVCVDDGLRNTPQHSRATAYGALVSHQLGI